MRKKTVFILQDTKESVDKVSKCFADSEDYEVTGTATDGINGVSLIADKKPDILITELVLSGYDGLSVIERIKELKANVKIIVLSALCREEAVMKAISAGADYFIAKPFSEKSLMSRVKELFRDCYGIWNQPDIPVEEIVLKYDALDGKFLKSVPLHHSQQVLVDNADEFRIKVRLRITNDFVMELLSRSRSLEVISPLHLRERVRKIYEEALKRNE